MDFQIASHQSEGYQISTEVYSGPLDLLLQLIEKAELDITKLALAQYQSGLIDFQAVLDAQRTYLSVRDSLATSKGTVIANLVRLYKALGGGWTPDAVQPQAAQTGKGKG